jgi:photosystem II stability/assembly factor-like uncharacterized protein
MRHFCVTVAVLLSVSAPVSAQNVRAPGAPPVDSTFTGFASRVIGPANTSGRVAAIDAVQSNPDIIYVGTATGGVWKSTDGGVVFEPIMDKEPVSSIGAVAVFQPNPDIVWVGTGEANPRNSMGVGRGVWKSLDAGRSWNFVGLPESERISRILLHPTDPDVAYVAALGPAWSDGEQRGVFQTTDGGKTWQKRLYVNPSTGAADLVMDPSNPNHMIAAMWDYRRTPWSFRSGGPGSGLHVTWDGGATWKKLSDKDGLPKGELGRTGLAFSRSNPNVVYALVEAEKSALLRSDDGGAKWRVVNDQNNVNPRPFYYADIRVDPVNENRVYRLASLLDVSEDGGKTFRTIAPWSAVHPDHHALWIEPTRGEILLNGNDGGVFISRNRGRTWRFVENLPVAQFYHLSFDMAQPFNVYGGLQDNGSWMGPSEIWEQPGFGGQNIGTQHWRTIGFGDGFAAVVDPKDADYVYSMSQGGYINRVDLRTGEWKSIRPQRPTDGTELRFNWNAGLAVDPHQVGTIYYGSQFVHKTNDRGQTWTIISPDLTTNDPEKQKQAESGGLTKDVTAAENHTTILTIGPSPLQEGVLWVGTDDGNVQVTRDGGQTWTNVVRNIRGVPSATWVPHIEPSKHDAGTAYVVFDNHRRGDWATYVYRTTDYGRSWTNIAGRGIDGFAHTIEEDPVNPNLLWVGTEFGLFFTLDGGRPWQKWMHDFPTVPVLAIATHPREHSLALGTHGRAAWIIDDVRPLRAMAGATGRAGTRASAALGQGAVRLFEIPAAVQHQRGLAGPYYFPGHGEFAGKNRPYGALITYHVAAGSANDTAKAKIQILDGGGEVIRELDGPMKKGVNRAVWNLRQKGFRQIVDEDTPEDFRPKGPEVLPGRYAVRLLAAGDTVTGTVEVLPDPRREVTPAARQAKRQALMQAGTTLERVTDAVTRLQAAGRTIDFVQEMLKDTLRSPAAVDSAGRAALLARADTVEKRLGELLDELRLPPTAIGIVEDRSAASELAEVYGALDSSTDEPTAGQMDEMQRREQRVQEILQRVERFYSSELEALRRELEAAGVGLFASPGRGTAATR